MAFTALDDSLVWLRVCHILDPIAQNLHLLVLHHLKVKIHHFRVELLRALEEASVRLKTVHSAVVLAQIVEDIFDTCKSSSQVISV